MQKVIPLFLLLSAIFSNQNIAAQQTQDSTAAQNFDSTAAPDDDLSKALRQMLATTNAVDIAITAAGGMLQQQAASTNPQLANFFVRFSEALQSERVRNHFQNMYVKIYRKYYTLDEVVQLNNFYKTPLGKKTLEVMPISLQESYAEGAKLGRMLATEILKELEIE